MKISLFISSVLTLILISTTGCKKKEPVITDYIPAELKEYALFQPGSFWIYENENTGNIDTTFISKKPEFIYYSASYDDNTITELCQMFYDGPFILTAHLKPYFYDIYFTHYGFEAINPRSFIPDQLFKLNGATTLTYLPLVDSMTISKNTFYNVFITEWQYITSKKDTFRNTSYFVKKIGLIKFNHKEPNADTTWHLITYHAIQ